MDYDTRDYDTLDHADSGSTSRALVDPRQASACRARAGEAERSPALASFVTQLLACAGNLPAYRTRRRMDPLDASSRYDAGDSLCLAGIPGRVRRLDRAL